MHQAPRPNRTTPPNPHPRQNRHVSTNPAILLNNDIPTQRRPLRPLPPPRINRIGRTNQFYIRAEDAPGPDLHLAGIRNPAVRGDEDVVPDGDVVPILARKGRFDDAVLAAAARGVEIAGRRGLAVGAWGFGCGAKSEDLARYVL